MPSHQHLSKGKQFNTQLRIYPLMGKVHKNFHTRMDDLQVYELPQQERPLTK